jgi:hypothetical protein
MTRNKQVRVIFAMIMIIVMMMPAVAYADGDESSVVAPVVEAPAPPASTSPAAPPASVMSETGAGAATAPSEPPPLGVAGPRLKPPPIPATDRVVQNLSNLPPPAIESDMADTGSPGHTQEAPGRGIKQVTTDIGTGITLYATPNVCNNFNTQSNFAVPQGKSDIWTDWYGGWGPFAIDNGYYKAKNVTFSMERVVGPGDNYNDALSAGNGEQNSIKIASHEPYAGGFGSPIIPVPDEFRGGAVLVSVKYLIWDHDQGGKQGGTDGIDYDWASMGVKPGAADPAAFYVNGYVRGIWSEMVQIVELRGAKDIMVLLQGQSPAVLNSNIYFDDVKIAFISFHGGDGHDGKHGDGYGKPGDDHDGYGKPGDGPDKPWGGGKPEDYIAKALYLTDCTVAGSIK